MIAQEKRPRKVSKRELRDIMTHLMWMGRDSFDKGDYLDDDEYLEFAKKILDVLAMDYTDAEKGVV